MHHHWSEMDRRQLIALGTAGLAALSLPGAAAAMMAQGFTHGVASGEPGANSVLLWTRYAAASDTTLTAELSETADFVKVVGGGSVSAIGERDHTAKLVVSGLEPGRWYYYRFVAPDGTMSLTGRTRTLPAGPTSAFTLALFSCSNLPFGWFNAYAHAAARQDIDLVVHSGDYLYEYPIGDYPSLKQAVPGRDIQPAHEMVALADYRLRYAAYRSDPDLARLHALFPMIAQWDDHEMTNDAWKGGAENHNAGEGEWADRVIAAERAYREWMPVADTRWRDYQVGDLATIFLPETRVTARDRQFEIDEIIAGGGDAAAKLKQFAETAYRDPARQMLGAEQENWLFGGFAASTKAGTRWQVCAQQVIMGTIFTPPETRDWFGGAQPDYIRRRVDAGQLAAKAGLPLNLDAWDGYPAARSRLLAAAQRADADLVTLTGDTHNAWALDLAEDGRPAGIEIAGQSVTSPGYESYIKGVTDEARVAALRRSSPQLKWANTQDRGYVTVQLTRDRVTANWHNVETIRTRTPGLKATHSMTAARGRRKYDAA
ncbi:MULTISPECIES: alkaline phosphatase D family protein [unclassified Sphingopyxis]|uniref:alkaline phosphatase D family protein n=1 Tax=unclassified Sphingopyxis TaxID=2614943 RepID=UPI00285CEDD0|nr:MULTISPECIES: alkaline phosphatase D family protein [unclassified Sphingopyxis]MDR6832764.1 alkaline phosphatase D [Sphingopyxis sp. BE122]MDR7228507.1 alkaline phosphatase D [Sphingopyxis sp. BE259]